MMKICYPEGKSVCIVVVDSFGANSRWGARHAIAILDTIKPPVDSCGGGCCGHDVCQSIEVLEQRYWRHFSELYGGVNSSREPVFLEATLELRVQALCLEAVLKYARRRP